MVTYQVRCSQARKVGASRAFGFVAEFVQASTPKLAENAFRERFETRAPLELRLQPPPPVRMIEVTYRGRTNQWVAKLVGSGKVKVVPHDDTLDATWGATQAAAQLLEEPWELDSMCGIDGGGYMFACRLVS